MKYLQCLLLMFILAGCTRINDSKKEEKIEEVTMQCTQKDEEILLFAKEDEIQKFQNRFTVSFQEAGITEDVDKDQVIDKLNDSLEEKYAKIKGVSTKAELKEDCIEVIIMIDYIQADINQLIEAGLIQKGEEESQYISLEKTIQAYKDMQYACEVK
ncbi:MAG: DUF1307 domain-containing protein [Holdemanella sp.]|nr:DUF1307 domain-containing protein [Holdemanella sp.]